MDTRIENESGTTTPDETGVAIEAIEERLSTAFLALCADPDDTEAAVRAQEAMRLLDVLLDPAAGSDPDGLLE
ncbi:hypothetical protein [Embleya sp. AB8]|uniref:hypothetical protein n=1 Tax=Embleya sp. AB8 TaxID=3156304 RepID=UPI003C75526C